MSRNKTVPEKILRDGGWWCRFCMRFVELNLDRELNVCARCGRPGARFCPPSHIARHEVSAAGFAAMRAAANGKG